MDTATRLSRSVLGVNVQFIHQDKIHIYTLAIKELNGAHTAENLKQQLQRVLQDFEIQNK